jgi:hypothetical protein
MLLSGWLNRLCTGRRFSRKLHRLSRARKRRIPHTPSFVELLEDRTLLAAGFIQQLTDNSVDDSFPQVNSNGNVVWAASDGNDIAKDVWRVQSTMIDLNDATVPALSFVERFDFGTSGSPLETNYTQVTHGTLYNSTLGYGWQGAVGSRDRGTGTALTRDLNFASVQTFLVDLPNATYQVTLTLGDEGPYGHDQTIFLEG